MYFCFLDILNGVIINLNCFTSQVLFRKNIIFFGGRIMPSRNLGSLGGMVRKKRGERKVRDVAEDIGISAATLLRIESGRIPDVATFGKVCQWLEVDPGSFLGFESKEARVDEPLTFSAHLKVDRAPKPETVQALAKMILFATKTQKSTQEIMEGEDA
jgi:transcriptional regulator with XRE-family HTH domain